MTFSLWADIPSCTKTSKGKSKAWHGWGEAKLEVRPYAYYPNPAKERLHFEYSPDVQPAKVELYDLQGRLVGTQRSNFEDIDVGKLPAGTYTLRVTLEDGKAYSDKVVKE